MVARVFSAALSGLVPARDDRRAEWVFREDSTDRCDRWTINPQLTRRSGGRRSGPLSCPPAGVAVTRNTVLIEQCREGLDPLRFSRCPICLLALVRGQVVEPSRGEPPVSWPGWPRGQVQLPRSLPDTEHGRLLGHAHRRLA